MARRVSSRLYTLRDSVLDDSEVVGDTLLHHPWAPLLAGAAGLIGWMAKFHIDVLKNAVAPRCQHGLRHGLGYSARYVVAHGTQMHAEYGQRVFWPVLVPSFVRAVPVNMAMFSTCEGALSRM